MSISRDEVRMGDVIRLALPAETQVLAGLSQVRRPVEWVVVMTDIGAVQPIREGDLVLIPAALQESLTDGELYEMFQGIAVRNVAGVIVFGPLAAALAERVDATLNLVLVHVAADVPLRDVNKTIAGFLIDRQIQLADRATKLYRELSELSREGQSFAAMADVLGRLSGNIVVIQDKRLEVLAFTIPPGAPAIDDVSLRAALSQKDNLPAVLRNRKAAARASRSHWQQLLFPNHNIARLVSPIISGDRARGYVSIIGEADSLDMLDKVAVEQGAAACALEMAKVKAVSEAKKQLRGNFLEGVLVGNLPQREVDRLASRLDHDTAQAHAIMVFRWGGEESPSLRRIETALNWLTSSSPGEALVHVYGDDHVCVFQMLRSGDDMAEAHRLAVRLRDQLEAELPEAELFGGISGPARNLSEWPEIHREAVQALDVGQRLYLNELVDYNSLGVYRLLGQLDSIPAVQEFCDQVIGPLVEYDKQHRSSLVKTIAAYFNHHGNVSQTAESLFIHRNTLLYRLDRIQDLTGHDLNQADMRLALQLALKLWQLRPDTRLDTD